MTFQSISDSNFSKKIFLTNMFFWPYEAIFDPEVAWSKYFSFLFPFVQVLSSKNLTMNVNLLISFFHFLSFLELVNLPHWRIFTLPLTHCLLFLENCDRHVSYTLNFWKCPASKEYWIPFLFFSALAECIMFTWLP